ncbi:hypothetical protein [Marinospirillum insulare]|uniref:hypothetical protein n=2 Tax=Marinospirillum insulare TaxID=217169 RepID=UPI000486D556|nr:hypothetical protein [Marinospirillum insulare]
MKLTVRVYKVESLGYYKNNVRQNDLGDVFSLLNGWKEWAEEEFPKELDSLNNILKDNEELTSENIEMLISSYFTIGEYKKNGGFLVGVWKGLPKSYYDRKALNIRTKKLTKKLYNINEIPGDPCLFWFLPDDDLLVSVSLKKQSEAKQVIINVLMGFLKNKSKYKVLMNNKVIGYSIDGNYKDGCDLVKPSFEISPIIYGDKEDEKEILVRDKSLINATIINRKINTDNLQGFNSYEEFEERRITIRPGFTDDDLKNKIEDLYSLKESDSSVAHVGFEYNNKRRVFLGCVESYFVYDYDYGIEIIKNEKINLDDVFKMLTDNKQDIFSNMGELNILKADF